jgi:hypothetical protein
MTSYKPRKLAHCLEEKGDYDIHVTPTYWTLVLGLHGQVNHGANEETWQDVRPNNSKAGTRIHLFQYNYCKLLLLTRLPQWPITFLSS